MPDAQKAIQAILQAMGSVTPGKPPRAARHRVICISRDMGSGGDEVARVLGKRLGLEVYGRQILDRISQRLHADPETMRAVDASARELRDLWLYSLVTGQDLDAGHYRRHLENIVLSLARSGGIILGSGAHLILARSGALRVRFAGTPEICVRRLAAANGGDPILLRKSVEEVNHRRAKFVQDTFQESLDNPRTFDLMINTDQFGDLNGVADLVTNAIALVE